MPIAKENISAKLFVIAPGAFSGARENRLADCFGFRIHLPVGDERLLSWNTPIQKSRLSGFPSTRGPLGLHRVPRGSASTRNIDGLHARISQSDRHIRRNSAAHFLR